MRTQGLPARSRICFASTTMSSPAAAVSPSKMIRYFSSSALPTPIVSAPTRFTSKKPAGSSRPKRTSSANRRTPSAKASGGRGALSMRAWAWRSARAWSHLNPARIRRTRSGQRSSPAAAQPVAVAPEELVDEALLLGRPALLAGGEPERGSEADEVDDRLAPRAVVEVGEPAPEARHRVLLDVRVAVKVDLGQRGGHVGEETAGLGGEGARSRSGSSRAAEAVSFRTRSGRSEKRGSAGSTARPSAAAARPARRARPRQRAAGAFPLHGRMALDLSSRSVGSGDRPDPAGRSPG